MNINELKRLWFYRKPVWAEEAWEHWIEQARQSGIAALQLFAQRLRGYWHGTLACCRHPLNTSVVEGINNTIKVIKRRADGYRDEEYFFLKIRAAFPGNFTRIADTRAIPLSARESGGTNRVFAITVESAPVIPTSS